MEAWGEPGMGQQAVPRADLTASPRRGLPGVAGMRRGLMRSPGRLPRRLAGGPQAERSHFPRRGPARLHAGRGAPPPLLPGSWPWDGVRRKGGGGWATSAGRGGGGKLGRSATAVEWEESRKREQFFFKFFIVKCGNVGREWLIRVNPHPRTLPLYFRLLNKSRWRAC